MKRSLIILLTAILPLFIIAQEDDASATWLGFGLGLEYGGMPGINLSFSPVKEAALYAGVGNVFTGVGFSAGAAYRFIPKNPEKRVTPYLTGMYGTNAVVRIVDARPLSKVFKGVTLGAGIEFHPVAGNNNHFAAAILIPLRGKDVYNYLDYLEESYAITYTSKLMPVLFSIGYRYAFKGK